MRVSDVLLMNPLRAVSGIPGGDTAWTAQIYSDCFLKMISSTMP